MIAKILLILFLLSNSIPVFAATNWFLDGNCKAGYNFDEASGNLIDQCADSNDGTLSGATQGATGQFGDAYGFGGDGDHVDCGNDGSLQGTGDLSLVAYVNSNNMNDAGQHVLSKHNNTTSTQGAYIHAISSSIDGFIFTITSGMF